MCKAIGIGREREREYKDPSKLQEGFVVTMSKPNQMTFEMILFNHPTLSPISLPGYRMFMLRFTKRQSN